MGIPSLRGITLAELKTFLPPHWADKSKMLPKMHEKTTQASAIRRFDTSFNFN
ncbi:MAG: hypothetical protein AAF171_02605 [Cyanobacteria bacterium P01_A01_bin.116]